MAERKENYRRRLFELEYQVDQNGTQAAIRAGYSERSAASIAEELLRDPTVRANIEKAMKKRMKKLELTADRVLMELMRVGFSDILSYVSWNRKGQIRFRSSKFLSEDEAAAIREISETEIEIDDMVKRERKFKLYDKLKALKMLSDHLALFDKKGGAEEAAKVMESFVDLVRKVAARNAAKKQPKT